MKFSHLSSVRVFSMTLPPITDLREAIEKIPFRAPEPVQLSSSGFAENELTGELVTPFLSGHGYSFDLRVDEKVIPPSLVKRLVAERIRELGLIRVNKAHKREITESVMLSLLPNALVKSSRITSFYLPASNLLLVSTSSRKKAQKVAGLLVNALGAVEAKTLYIDDLKNGLTTRVLAQLTDPNLDNFPLGEFDLGHSLTLERRGDFKERLTFVADDLASESLGLEAAIENGFSVAKVQLDLGGGVIFTISSDFVISGVKFEHLPDDQGGDVVAEWRHEAEVRCLTLGRVVGELLTMFGTATEKETDDGDAYDPADSDVPADDYHEEDGVI